MNSSTTTTFNWQAIPNTIHFFVDIFGVLTNLLIIILYVKYAALRSISGLHLMFILAIADLLVNGGDLFIIFKLMLSLVKINVVPPMAKYLCFMCITPHFVGK
jgi:hypothetical protein